MIPDKKPPRDSLEDEIHRANAICDDTSITRRAFKALSELCDVLDEESRAETGFIRERDTLSKSLRRIAIWIDKNPPPPRKKDN